MRLLRLVAHLWARINGLVDSYHTSDGIEVLVVKRLRPGWAAAQTIGECVLVRQDYDGHIWLMEHERVHVRQFRRYGLWMPILYVLDSLRQMLQGKHYYKDNRFEVEARKESGW